MLLLAGAFTTAESRRVWLVLVALTVATLLGALTWIHYSFVTLTTMGYGDITPVHPIARSLAISEALAGQFHIAVMLSRLMALHVTTDSKS